MRRGIAKAVGQAWPEMTGKRTRTPEPLSTPGQRDGLARRRAAPTVRGVTMRSKNFDIVAAIENLERVLAEDNAASSLAARIDQALQDLQRAVQHHAATLQ